MPISPDLDLAIFVVMTMTTTTTDGQNRLLYPLRMRGVKIASHRRGPSLRFVLYLNLLILGQLLWTVLRAVLWTNEMGYIYIPVARNLW